MTDIKKQYYAAKFFCEGGFYIPIWYYYLTQHCKIDESSAFLLQSLLYGSMFVSEIPSGAWADRYGRKKLLIFAGVLKLSSLFIYYSFSSTSFFVVAAILAGLGVSASSGTVEALVTDNLSYKNEDTQGIFESGHSFFFAGRAVSMFVGGYLYQIEPTLPYLAAIIFISMFIIVVSLMEESPYRKSQATNNYQHFKETFKIISSYQILYRWLICISVAFFLADVTWFEYQTVFNAFHWGTETSGKIFCFHACASSFGAWYSKKLLNFLTSKNVLIFSTLAWGIGCLTLTFQSIPLVLLGSFLSSIAYGGAYPSYVRLVNHVVSSEQRATVISLIGFIEVLACALIASYCGYVNQAIGAILFLRMCGVALLVLPILFFYFVPSTENVS